MKNAARRKSKKPVQIKKPISASQLEKLIAAGYLPIFVGSGLK